MTEANGNNGQKTTVTDAWSKNWHVPVILSMLRQWNSYGYELMEKNVGVRAEYNESRDILSDVAADGEGWSREFQLGYFGGRTGTSCVFDHGGGRGVPEALDRIS